MWLIWVNQESKISLFLYHGRYLEREVDKPSSRGKSLAVKKTPNNQNLTAQQKGLEDATSFVLSYLESDGLASNSPFVFVHEVSPVTMPFPNRHQALVLGKCPGVGGDQGAAEEEPGSLGEEEELGSLQGFFNLSFLNLVIPTLERFLPSEPVEDSRHCSTSVLQLVKCKHASREGRFYSPASFIKPDMYCTL